MFLERRADHRSRKGNIETRTNGWGSEEWFENPRFLDLGLDLDFPPCHRSLYTRAISVFWGGNRAPTRLENRVAAVLKRFSATKIYIPSWKHLLVPLIPPLRTFPRLRSAVQRTLFIFFSRFVVVMSPHLSRIRGNNTVPPRIYATICISSR